MSKLCSKCVTLALVLLLSACATRVPSTVPSDQPWRTDASIFSKQTAYYQGLSNWHYRAKVGITTPQGREQASMDWSFADQANSIRLYGPLGLGAVLIQFDDFGVVLSDNKGVRHRGQNVQELLDRIIGWPIPVESLVNWLFLVPHENSPFRYRLDPSGRLQTLEQQGWRIEYSMYKEFNQQLMPRKITAVRLHKDSADKAVKVRLISKDWQW